MGPKPISTHAPAAAAVVAAAAATSNSANALSCLTMQCYVQFILDTNY